MLCEKIFYERDIPVEVTAILLENYPMHYHKDIELLYVLDGEARVKCSGRIRKASKGVVTVINGLELHEVSAVTDDCVVMMLHLDTEYFKRYYPELEDTYYYCDAHGAGSAAIIANYMRKMMMALITKGELYEDEVVETAHNIIASLGIKTHETEANGNSATRLRRVLQYACDNYQRKLTLKEIADREDLNLYYLSHNIKDASGHSFQQLLNYIRVEASEELLLNTDMSIGQIASETGFSAVRYYTKHFEEWLHMPPLEYRKKYAGESVIHKPDVVGKRCSAVLIEELISKEMPKEVSDVSGEDEIIEITMIPEDFLETGIEEKGIDRPLEDLMGRDVIKVLMEPYLRFTALGENVVDEGYNYLITSPAGKSGDISIFLIGVDEIMARSLAEVESDEELLRLSEEYNKRIEFILDFQGLKGEYQALRYRLSKSGLIRQMSMSAGIKGVLDGRERLKRELEAEPTVYKVNYTSTGGFRIRSAFDGLGIEMILLSKTNN